jgi:uncharacterized repeat protein (TIGR02543 family)
MHVMKKVLFTLVSLTSLLVFFSCRTPPSAMAAPVSIVTCGVSYRTNGATGGSVPADTNLYLKGSTVSVKGNNPGTLVNTGYAFNGWNTSSSETGTTCDADEVFGSSTRTMGEDDVALYAVWADPMVGS